MRTPIWCDCTARWDVWPGNELTPQLAPRLPSAIGRKRLRRGKWRAIMHVGYSGGERGPVISPAFKAGDSVLSGSNGGFDSHTLPPIIGLKIDCVTDFNSDRASSGLLSQRLQAAISRPRSRSE